MSDSLSPANAPSGFLLAPGDSPAGSRPPGAELGETPADLLPFRVGSIEFQCFAAWDQPGTPYVWRSTCKRGAVGRVGAFCWARVDGRLLGKDYQSLRTAMIAAAMELVVSGARAAA